ncbi:MAG: S9 family peptidase [Calditrichaeota bacterium]|nr:S9 family peptidase [Calditrichota bacterium]
MQKLLSVALLIVLIITLSGCVKSEKEPPLIPVEDFFRNPLKTNFKLSPNGDHIAFLQPWKNRMNIYVQTVEQQNALRLTQSKERDIRYFDWANDNRIVFVQDRNGDENYKLYGVDIDGKNLKVLTPFENTRVVLIDALEDNPQEMLIGLNRRNPEIFDVYRINIDTGDLKMIAKNPGNISDWFTDWNGCLRLAISTDGVNESLLYRKSEKDSFRAVITTNFREILYPLYFLFDEPDVIYAASNLHRDKAVIVKFDLNEARETEVIYQHPEVDVFKLLVSKKRKVPTGVVYVTDKPRYHFFDQERKKLQKILRKKLPQYEVSVENMSRDETKVLVKTYNDKTRGSYYYFDRKTGEFFKLADLSPWLKEKYLADMRPIRYKSRDGLVINGYLTLPKSAGEQKLPLVVHPHGGPWSRDVWKFDPEVQFLANRGYAVLQMNYRGSTGYGRQFWELGFKQWGRKIQDDITDGVLWLISRGRVDSSRVGIFGASFGGYAALAGLAFTPELYACGVDYVGVSNLFTFLESIPAYWRPYREMLYEMVGHPEKDKKLLEQTSPALHADKIRAPLLIAQGANDPRVNKAESDQMVKALKERGVEVVYIVKQDEGHGFQKEENRIEFYKAVEQFLAKYLGGRAMSKKE